MKSVVVYYSMSGNTEYVAEKIAKELKADTIRLVPKKEYPNKGFRKFFWGGKSALMGDVPELEEYSFDSKKYDCVIFGSPVWASQFTPPVRTFIQNHKKELQNKKIGAFLCLSGMGDKNAFSKLKELLEIDSFLAKVAIVDPKDKPNDEKEKQIKEFCKKIK